MQLHELGYAVPEFPLVPAVIRAYRRWEEENHPLRKVRCGITATVMKKIWGLGMSTTSPSVLRDAACCLFAYCLNGLRESSVLTMLTDNVTVDAQSLKARLSMLKGKLTRHDTIIAYHRWDELPSPIDLWERCSVARGSHPRLFSLDGEGVAVSAGAMTKSLHICLKEIKHSPPPGGKYTSHSLRIGAHTEQVLLGIKIEMRLARFGWGPRSDEIAALYFDRTMRVSAASFWILGPGDPSAVLSSRSVPAASVYG